jgi:ATP-dependent helicase HrpB
VRRVRDRAVDLARRASVTFDPDEVDADRAGLLLLGGFPDRLAARRRGGQFQLRSGSSAWVDETDPLASAPFVVAADLDGQRSGARIRLGASVGADEITALLDGVVEQVRLEWSAERDDLVQRVERRLDALRLGDDVGPAPAGPETATALAARVRATKLGALRWTEGARQVQARVAFLRAAMPDSDWPDLSDAALLSGLDEWLSPFLGGATGRADLERIDVALLLRHRLAWPRGSELDQLAPTTWTLPTGRTVPIDYRSGRPEAAARVQDVFGLTVHPTVGNGRAPVTLSLLSPADRPLQVTADLPGFWAGSWAAVRKELAGRYPKHRWPLDPAHERPGR